MVSAKDRDTIKTVAQRYHVGRVLLFGSSVGQQRSRDIDLAVEGLAPSRFFAFYGELIISLSKPVDLVDLSKKSRFTDMIRRDGVAVYG